MEQELGVGLNEAFLVTRLLPIGLTSLLAASLTALPGVDHVGTDDKGRTAIRYDASQIGFPEIEAILDEAGIARPTDLWWRMRAEWYRFTDANARANAHAKHACCSRPPAVPGVADKR